MPKPAELARLRHAFLSSPEEIIEEAKNGRMFILVDDEDRENEGDLVIPAQMATPEKVNFMARHGRGLICLALAKSRVDQLGLDLMSRNNGTRHETAFTVSIEARDGVTTGISAADRARTIAVAIDAAKGKDEIVTPGHVFPLIARDGGVLVRAGHTEAAVDVARLAGLNPSGVICEIMNEDGTMARMDDLVAFAQLHNLKIGTIRDLIAYRRRHDHLVQKQAEMTFESRWGGSWRAITFFNKATGDETIALVKGRIDPASPTLVRMHTASFFVDMFGEQSDRTGLLSRSMELIAGARAAIEEAGHQADIVTVPGALELPGAIALAAETGRYDAYVALGVVIRGETYHFEIVSNESARGLMALTMDGLPIGNDILTTENEEQAIRR
ncbi:MAG: 3,4-dihydroxy-2-butanone-4-phosphate synthase, partial [Sphingomonadales bacterium]|nr:3,4-dihydroxy-2-butanone-4-phosphate synthase [Sphingomonadales bacterium]